MGGFSLWIEGVYNSVKNEFDTNITQRIEDTVLALGITNMHKDLVHLVGQFAISG